MRRFLVRDHDAERRAQEGQLTTILDALSELSGVQAALLTSEQSPRPYATAIVHIDTQLIGRPVETIINELIEGDPPIAVSQNFLHEQAFGLIASSLQEGEEMLVALRLRSVLASRP
jgi:hypothetical protein